MGATGAAGADGQNGQDGSQGATGAQGTTGAAGANGADGAQGTTGATGAAGANGQDGQDGAQGGTGAQGPAGPAGPQGATGATGAQGPAGPEGATGPQGPIGPTGPSGVTQVRKTVNDTTTSTTLQNTTELGFTLAASTAYTFDYYILFQSAATGTGIALAVNGPAAPSTISYTVQIPLGTDGNSTMWSGPGTYLDDPVLTGSVQAANTTYLARITGVIRTNASGGTLLPRFRSETAGTTVRVMAQSWGALHTP
jgi:hypothetical protein